MNIIINELKKIWRVKILAIITFLCIGYFVLFMNHYIEHYPRGTWGGSVDFAHHLTENYGTSLTFSDFEEFLDYREIMASELDLFIASNTIFTDAGIYDFQSYEAFLVDSDYRYETLTESERSLRYTLLLEFGYAIRSDFIYEGETVELQSDNEIPISYMRIRSFDNVVAMYQESVLGESEWESRIDSLIYNSSLSRNEVQRLITIRDSGELQNITPQHAIWHTLSYVQSLAILTILVTLILVFPFAIATKRAEKNLLQPSPNQGQFSLKKQFIAVLISAVGITTILVIIFAGIFSTTEVQAFWNNGINSFLSDIFHWLSITFGQYVLLMIGVIYLLSIATATFTFVLSYFSKNMKGLALKSILLFIALLMLSNWILNNFLVVVMGRNVLIKISLLAFLQVVGVAGAMIAIRREKTNEDLKRHKL